MFEIGESVRVHGVPVYCGGKLADPSAIGRVEDVTVDGCYYVVFDDLTYTDYGSEVTVTGVFDEAELRPAPDAVETCMEFSEYGSCTHSDCMAGVGA